MEVEHADEVHGISVDQFKKDLEEKDRVISVAAGRNLRVRDSLCCRNWKKLAGEKPAIGSSKFAAYHKGKVEIYISHAESVQLEEKTHYCTELISRVRSVKCVGFCN